MSGENETLRVQLNYPLERVREPILYQLVVNYGLIPDIRRANFDLHSGGFIVLELSGEKEALDRGLKWLEEVGVTVSAVGLDSTQEWAV